MYKITSVKRKANSPSTAELKRINQILTQRSCARTELVVRERAIKISEVSKHARKNFPYHFSQLGRFTSSACLWFKRRTGAQFFIIRVEGSAVPTIMRPFLKFLNLKHNNTNHTTTILLKSFIPNIASY